MKQLPEVVIDSNKTIPTIMPDYLKMHEVWDMGTYIWRDIINYDLILRSVKWNEISFYNVPKRYLNLADMNENDVDKHLTHIRFHPEICANLAYFKERCRLIYIDTNRVEHEITLPELMKYNFMAFLALSSLNEQPIRYHNLNITKTDCWGFIDFLHHKDNWKTRGHVFKLEDWGYTVCWKWKLPEKIETWDIFVTWMTKSENPNKLHAFIKSKNIKLYNHHFALHVKDGCFVSKFWESSLFFNHMSELFRAYPYTKCYEIKRNLNS